MFSAWSQGFLGSDVQAEAEAFAVALVNIKLYPDLLDYLWTFDKYVSLFSNNILNFPSSETAFVSLSTSYDPQLPHNLHSDQKLDLLYGLTTEKVCFFSFSSFII